MTNTITEYLFIVIHMCSQDTEITPVISGHWLCLKYKVVIIT